MSMTSQMPPELLNTCESWSKTLKQQTDVTSQIAAIRDALPRLLENRDLMLDILQRIARGDAYPDTRRATMFENEIILYLNERRLFSLRMLLSGPGDFTPIHDHNAWGVIAPFSGTLDVISYRRLNDGSGDPAAPIEKTGHRVLSPVETAAVLPLDEGIHSTGNSGDETLVMLSVYGTPVRRPYVRGFDPDRNRVFRIYPQRKRKRMLAESVIRKSAGAAP